MFKKIRALFTRYNAEERIESDLAQERAKQGQERVARQAREKMGQSTDPEVIQPEEQEEVPIEVPETGDDRDSMPKAA